MSLSIHNTIFKELVDKYSTWEQLQKYLESEEGGLFRVVDTNADKALALIRYEKGTTKMDLPHSRWFRSVVWNTHTNRPVSVAPPKTTPGEFSFETFKEVADAGIVCQELLDGFMINCFRVAGDETLFITSRSKLDGTGKFYSDKTFRELFMESFEASVGSTNVLCGPDSSKNEVAHFYSFLVQHKEHRIVKNITENRVYLIHSGVVYDDGRVDIEDSPTEFAGKPNMVSLNLEPHAITKGTWAQVISRPLDENEIRTWLKNMMADKSWEFQGVVFKDSVGNRWRFRNEKYSAVKSLRGNSMLVRDRFCQLFSQNLVHKYLEYYPEDTFKISQQLLLANAVIDLLYDYYVRLHITKTVTVDKINKMYHPHLYSIHGIFLTQLRPNKLAVTKKDIQLYLHKLPWQRLAFLIKKLNEQLTTSVAT